MQIGYVRLEQGLPSIEEQRQALGAAGFDLSDPRVPIYARGDRGRAIARMKRGDTLVLAAAGCLGNSLLDITDALVEIGQRGGSVLDLKSGTMISPSADRAEALEYARNAKLSKWSKVDAILSGKRGRAVFHWTSEKVAKLKTMSAAGETEEAMAEALGCSRAAIRRELRALGLGPVGESRPRRPWLEWSDENVAKLKEMRAAGESQTAIARELGCALKTLSLKMSELGLSSQGKHVFEWSPERVAKLKSMVAAGVPVPTIAAEIGVSRATVYNKIKELGLETVGPAKYDWTPAKIAKLKSMVEEGETITKITKEIGCSVSTAAGKIAELGLKTRFQDGYRKHAYDWTPEKLAKLKEMVEARETQAAMADEFGLHWVTIAKKLRALNLKSKGQRRGYDWTPDKVAKLEEMVAAEVSQVEMAKELNCSVSSIRHQLVSLGRTPDGKHVARWSPEDIAKLKSMTAAGETRTAMAAALRRSRPAISYKLDALGLTSSVKSSGSAPKSSGGAPGGRRDFKWTAADIAKLREMCAAGEAQAAMAAALGCTQKTVSLKISELGLSSRGKYVIAWSPERVAKLNSMVAAREPVPTIAAELGVSTATVYNIIRELGLKSVGQAKYDWTPAKIAKLKSMVEEGESIPKISKEIGCSYPITLGKMAELGLKTRGQDGYRKQAYDWTPEKLAKLKEMVDAGETQAAMADEFGLHKVTINKKLKALKLKSKAKGGTRGYDWTPAKDAKLKSMVIAGESQEAMAEALGCDIQTLRNKLKEIMLGPPSAPPAKRFEWTAANTAKLKEMSAAGETQWAMAQALRCGNKAVSSKLAELGLSSRGSYVVAWPPEKVAKLKSMISAGESLVEISAELGASVPTIQKKMKEIGLKPAGHKRYDWTPEKVARLKSMVAAGDTVATIADEIGCNRSTLFKKLADLGLKTRGRAYDWTPASVSKLRKMVAAGHSQDAMAAELGVDDTTIHRKLKSLGLKSRGKFGARGHQWTPEEIAKLKELVAAGATHKEIADALGCSDGAVQHRMNVLGLKPKGRLGRHGFDWTPEKEAKLKEMVAAGKTQRAMSSEFDLNIASINRKLKSLGLKSKGKLGRYAFDWTPKKDAKLKAMFAAGQPQKAMMDEIGCSRITLRKRLDTLGLIWFKWTPEKLSRLEDMWAAGETEVAISAKLGCSPQDLLSKLVDLEKVSFRTVWTPQKTATLRAMHKRGVPTRGMANALNLRDSAITKKLNELGLDLPGKPTNWPPARLAKLKAMCEQGATAHEIADAIDCSPTTVYTKSAEIGVRPRLYRGMIWTPEQVSKLREMVAAGKTQSSIAVELGVSAATISSKRNELGLKILQIQNRKIDWTPDMISKLKEMNAEGATAQEMAEALGYSCSTVLKKKAELGLKPSREQKINWTPGKIAKLKAMREEGATIMMMAEAFGYSKGTIQRRLAALGLTSPQARKINWTPGKIAKLKEMREEGATYMMMAEAFGCSKVTIHKKLAEFGLI